jgi:hypothetical protein
MPEPQETELAGLGLPLIRLAPFESSAVAKLRLALRLALDRPRRAVAVAVP